MLCILGVIAGFMYWRRNNNNNNTRNIDNASNGSTNIDNLVGSEQNEQQQDTYNNNDNDNNVGNDDNVSTTATQVLSATTSNNNDEWDRWILLLFVSCIIGSISYCSNTIHNIMELDKQQQQQQQIQNESSFFFQQLMDVHLEGLFEHYIQLISIASMIISILVPCFTGGAIDFVRSNSFCLLCFCFYCIVGQGLITIGIVTLQFRSWKLIIAGQILLEIGTKATMVTCLTMLYPYFKIHNNIGFIYGIVFASNQFFGNIWNHFIISTTIHSLKSIIQMFWINFVIIIDALLLSMLLYYYYFLSNQTITTNNINNNNQTTPLQQQQEQTTAATIQQQLSESNNAQLMEPLLSPANQQQQQQQALVEEIAEIEAQQHQQPQQLPESSEQSEPIGPLDTTILSSAGRDDSSDPEVSNNSLLASSSSSTTTTATSPNCKTIILWYSFIAMFMFFVNGCIATLDHYTSKLLLDHVYFNTPNSDNCVLQYPTQCTLGTLQNHSNPSFIPNSNRNDTTAKNTTTLTCPGSYFAPVLPTSLHLNDGYDLRTVSKSTVDCTKSFWSNGCTRDYCNALDRATQWIEYIKLSLSIASVLWFLLAGFYYIYFQCPSTRAIYDSQQSIDNDNNNYLFYLIPLKLCGIYSTILFLTSKMTTTTKIVSISTITTMRLIMVPFLLHLHTIVHVTFLILIWSQYMQQQQQPLSSMPPTLALSSTSTRLLSLNKLVGNQIGIMLTMQNAGRFVFVYLITKLEVF